MEIARKYPATFASVGERAAISVVFGLFFISGSAALLYQVIWQRVLAIFSGADIYSITIIVAAYMAGLGCGSLAGGYIADRVSIKARVAIFSLAELSIALFALVSKWLYYDLLYLQFSYLAESPAVLALVLFASLLWPTFFMGMSLPLLSRALTRRVESAAGMIGSLYAFNTLGAATGAFVATWIFARTFGFEATIQIGAALNLIAAAGAMALYPYLVRTGQRDEGNAASANVEREEVVEQSTTGVTVGAVGFPVQVWIAIYCLSGFVALSLEILWFRLLGVMLKSNAFTFGNLLAIYLAGLAYGTFLGIRWARTSRNPARTFFMLQAGIAAYAGLSVILLAGGLGNLEAMRPLWTYFGGYDGIDVNVSLDALGQFFTAPHVFSSDTERRALTFLMLYFVLPLALIGPPTLMMGLSFPFLQKVVQRDVATLGRRVGWLQTANIFGSMLGAVGTGWVFLRFLGLSLTLQLLLVVGGIFAMLYA
ncbi:MAG: fused MFS/spermidine synthase, partial [Chloroflexota bacterium]|nr:fused MFS/spermidine synthase [Chloroflexota bacterium]